jgi:expansin (peptidoglycan-binding protein)
MKYIFCLSLVTVVYVAISQTCPTASYSGEATYYNLLDQGNIGNCTFDNDKIKPYYGAMSTPTYNTAATCGACYEVTGDVGTRVIQIVDQCPTCTGGEDIDLGPQAFQEIVGPLSIGRAAITYFEVPCPWGTDPIDVIIQGSNAYYGKVIIARHINRINQVEINNGGVWQDMVRGEDNGWVKGSLGGFSSYDIRITDIYGEEIIVEGVDLSIGDGTVQGTSNFTPCTITGSREVIAQHVTVFPNPATERLVVEGVLPNQTLEIIDRYGKVRYTQAVKESEGKVTLAVAGLEQGLYVLKYSDQDGNLGTKTFIKN